MTRSAQLTIALALAIVVAACGGSSNTTPVVAPTGTLVTETFNGIAQPGGALSFNPFTVTVGGAINATLVAAGPPPTIQMGLGIGTPGGGTCALLSGGSVAASASTAAQLNGTLTAGTYCLAVFDIGNAAGPITYTVTVAHT